MKVTKAPKPKGPKSPDARHPPKPPRAPKARGTGAPERLTGSALPISGSLFFKLARVVNLTARPFVETLSREHRLSLNEWRAMVVLASRPGVAATDVVDATGLDKMSVSRALAGLARRRRITKAADPLDGRRALLTLSAAGESLYRRIGAHATRREAQLFVGVRATEQAQLAATLDRLIAALSESEAEQARANGRRAGR